MLFKLPFSSLIGAALLSAFALAQDAFDDEETKSLYNTLVYVHSRLPERGYDYYRDHSQGAHLLPEEAILIAEKDTADLIATAADPLRRSPISSSTTKTFQRRAVFASN